MGNTTTNNTTSTTVEDVYEEEKDTREYGASTDEIITRIGILDEIEDKEIARWGHTLSRGRAVGEAGGCGAPAEDKEIARWGTSIGGRAGGEAPALMDKIHTSTPIEDRIQILSGEMIKRGLETEESFKRLRSYEKKRSEYRCLMEELARYYDRQTALGLPIEQPVLKTGVYMQHVILL
jgi:hypothetical protein